MLATNQRQDLFPSGVLLICASAWGLFWIPLRYVSEHGFIGAWSTTVYFGFSLLLLAPVMVVRYRQLRAGGWELFLTGLFSGAAIALYVLSFLFTTVAKALLIFYMTPVWSTVLGCMLLRESLPFSRVLAVALGLSGLWVILGSETGIPLPRNAGDLMALTGGLLWAYAAVRLNRSTAHSLDWVSMFFVAGLGVSILCLALTPQLFTPPGIDALTDWGFVVLVALVVISLPANFAILWATNRLSPGRVGLLMLMEVVVGISVAAVLTDEPYRVSEAIGTLLIVCAAIVDIVRPPVQ